MEHVYLFLTINDETRTISLWDYYKEEPGERTVLLTLTPEQVAVMFPYSGGPDGYNVGVA